MQIHGVYMILKQWKHETNRTFCQLKCEKWELESKNNTNKILSSSFYRRKNWERKIKQLGPGYKLTKNHDLYLGRSDSNVPNFSYCA